jgi:hypothetical protein
MRVFLGFFDALKKLSRLAGPHVAPQVKTAQAADLKNFVNEKTLFKNKN